MKQLLFSALASFLFFGVSSCVKVTFEEGDGNLTPTPSEPTSNIITGVITSSKFYAKGKWVLKGYVYVTNGATVTFEAGCVVQSDVSEKGALIIERGAKIIASGTKDNPIVFTSGKPIGSRAPGDWGGIIILGKAPTNRPLDPAPVIEGGVGRQYGGTDPFDESGVLRFVRIEYAGIAAEPGSEINGLTCGGVGSGTIIENVMVSYGNDDAFEFFGGTVNAKNLIAFATADDDFDFDFGYTGKIQFAIALRKPDFVDAGDAGNGIECDNDASGTSAIPLTRPQLSNFTIVGPNDAVGTAANHNFAMRWRRRTQFVVRNSIFIGHPDAGFSMESTGTIQDYYSNNLSEFRNNLVQASNNVYHLPSNTTSVSVAMVRAKAEGEGCLTLASSTAAELTSPIFSAAPNFLPKTGSPALSGANFIGMNTFFTTTTFRGAMGFTDWTAGWANWDPQNKVY
jgi:hypothetical protein